MKKGFLLLFVLYLSAGYSYSQQYYVSGKITDAKSGLPVQGAIVFISSSLKGISNSEGEYRINGISGEEITVKVSRLSYLSQSKAFSAAGHIKADFALEPAPIEMDEVIVSTDRIDKVLRNSPFSESVIGTGMIEKKNYNSLPDALQKEAGISLLRDGIWGTEVSLRGLNRENVVALIDGSRIATSTDISARFSMVDINDVERVEVIKGASSAIYGSGATGGIVNIITKQPDRFNSFGLRGNLSAGFNTVNNSSLLSGALFSGDSFWSAKISGSFRKALNTATPSGELKNSQFKDYSLSASLNFYTFENQTLKLDYQLFKAEDVGIPGASVFPDNADVRYPLERRELFSAGYEILNISKLLYRVAARYSNQAIARDVENIPHTVQNIPASGPNPARRVSVLKITPAADHNNNNFQVNAGMLFGERYNLVVGIDYWDRRYNGSREKYQQIEALNSGGSVISTVNKIIGEKPLPDSKYSSLGIFAQNEVELIKEKLNVSLGGRVDKIWVKGESALNPVYEIVNGVINYSPAGQKTIWNSIESDDISFGGNLGLKYAATENLDLTLSLGISFRSPSLEERFQYIDQGSYVRVGKPDLNPERGKSADLGIRYYASSFKLVTSIFYNYFNDMVAELPGTFDGRNAFIKTNIGEAKLYGFDLRTDYAFQNGIALYASASYVRGEDVTSGGNLAEIPPLNGTGGLKAEMFNIFNADLSVTLFDSQRKTAAGEPETPGYAVFNIFADSFPFKIDRFEMRVSAGIENIFNREYRNHLSTFRGNMFFEPGRNFQLKLNIKW